MPKFHRSYNTNVEFENGLALAFFGCEYNLQELAVNVKSVNDDFSMNLRQITEIT